MTLTEPKYDFFDPANLLLHLNCEITMSLTLLVGLTSKGFCQIFNLNNKFNLGSFLSLKGSLNSNPKKPKHFKNKISTIAAKNFNFWNKFQLFQLFFSF